MHFKKATFLSVLIFLFFCGADCVAQQVTQPIPGSPTTLQNAPQRDTSNKTNTNEWRDVSTVISYKIINSKKKFYPDSSLHIFHRRKFTRDWNYDLGNSGSPVKNLEFTPEYRVGPTLGYHVFDVYRFHPDSLKFYNTTRPYSSFTYQLGSKAEQLAELLHTQNILPNWNFAVQYRKINAPGYYKIQRNNYDFANLTTNYESKDQHYSLKVVFIYNKVQHDENGGIISDSFLTDNSFTDRRTVPVRFQNDAYSNRRSAVTNNLRDFSFLLLHSYTIGKTDTLYSADSTQFSAHLTRRFGISHRFQLSSEKYEYKDLRPDSLRYDGFFTQSFGTKDSVFTQQKWLMVKNEFMLNGFVGKQQNQLMAGVGIGNRFDRFITEFGTGNNTGSTISNYLTGEIKKEALTEKEWSYNANAKFFFTGEAAGNFILHADAGKNISAKIGDITAGFEQRISNAPYNYTLYQNQFTTKTKDYAKESVTQLFATFSNAPLKLSAGFKNYFIGNYIYLNEQKDFDQYTAPFNISQLSLRKIFTFGIWVFDNEILYQQTTGNAPVNIPAFMGRHQLSIETYLFGNALKVATGIDVRWHTPYMPSSYSPFLGRFYYLQNYSVSNIPEAALFFNFKVKSFRAYVMGDQFQQLFAKKNIITAQGYPAPNTMIRFGFNWVLIN